MAAISPIPSTIQFQHPCNCIGTAKAALVPGEASSSRLRVKINRSMFCYTSIRKSISKFALAADVPAMTSSEPEAKRRLYVGNIPRSLSNEELANLFGEHGSVEKAEIIYDKYSGRSRRFAFVTMSSVEDANSAIEKLKETEIGGRKIKINVTEKPLNSIDLSHPQTDESKFIDSPYKVYVGNLTKTVTSDLLKKFFSEKGKVLGAKVSMVPGTSKSSGFGFVSFSSEEDVEATISSFNNAIIYDKYSGRSRRFAFVTMSSVEDANSAIEKLKETEIGGRKIKINVTEKPLNSIDLSHAQADESKFIDSPYKVYVGNLTKTVTSDLLKKFFSEKGKVLGAKVSMVPGTSKSSGFGFVSFSSEEDVEATISSFNNALFEGQKIRVNRA